jgi:hypothetical protein
MLCKDRAQFFEQNNRIWTLPIRAFRIVDLIGQWAGELVTAQF